MRNKTEAIVLTANGLNYLIKWNCNKIYLIQTRRPKAAAKEQRQGEPRLVSDTISTCKG